MLGESWAPMKHAYLLSRHPLIDLGYGLYVTMS